MAYRLVVDGGCPAAVGMNEPIQASDATTFSQAFYSCLFDLLRNTLQPAAGPVELDFTPALVAVRRALHDLYVANPPDAFGRWSLPVLYVSREGLKVQMI